MFYQLEQKVSEFYVKVRVPPEIKRGCRDSEFQYLNHRGLAIELETDYGTDFPDLIMAENYVPMISNSLKRMFDLWGIDNLYYKKLILKMPDFDIEETYWLALPPRIDCLDPESFDKEFNVCDKIVIISNRVGNYDIFKLQGGNDELVITGRLKQLLEAEMDSHSLQGIIIKKI